MLTTYETTLDGMAIRVRADWSDPRSLVEAQFADNGETWFNLPSGENVSDVDASECEHCYAIGECDTQTKAMELALLDWWMEGEYSTDEIRQALRDIVEVPTVQEAS